MADEASYGPVVELAGGKPVILKTSIENDFKLTPAQIAKACTKGVRALMINYPCNPTGASYTKKELLAIAKVIKKRNLLVISDATDTLLEISKAGKILHAHHLPGDDQEGITKDNSGFFYLAQDSGGIIRFQWKNH